MWKVVPPWQELPGTSELGYFGALLDLSRVPTGIDHEGPWPEKVPVPVRGTLSPLAMAHHGLVSERGLAALQAIAPSAGVNERRQPVDCVEPDGSVVRFVSLAYSKEPFVSGLLPLHCQPVFPERNDDESVDDYWLRLSRSAVFGRIFAFDQGVATSTEPWITSSVRGTICNDAYRERWQQSDLSRYIADNGWTDYDFTPLQDAVPYTLVDPSAAALIDDGRGGPDLFTIWFDLEIYPDDDEAPRHLFPVNTRRLGRRRSKELLALAWSLNPLPSWTATDPIPAKRALRHLEPDYAAVSDAVFDQLQEIMGDTVSSGQAFLLKGSDGEVRRYHRLKPNVARLEVDWDQVRPPLVGVDTTSDNAIAKALRSEEKITTLALRDSLAASAGFLYHRHLASGIVVSDRFVESWRATPIAQAMKSNGEPGLSMRPISGGSIDYRWVTST